MNAERLTKDLRAAVHFYNRAFPCGLKWSDLHFEGIQKMSPESFIDVPKRLKEDPRGWLRKHRREDWLHALASKYHRNFRHILIYYSQRKMPPAIQIDGTLGDGRGRACFHYALDLATMPVAVYVTEEK